MPVNIKGKSYTTVNERITMFRKEHGSKYSLTTEIIELTEEKVVMKAIIKDEAERVIANGLAFEMAGSSFINKTSYIENCETSAWGRCLGNLGYGLEESVATADEVQNAIANQNPAYYKRSKFDTIKEDFAGCSVITINKQLENYGVDKLRDLEKEDYEKVKLACNGGK